MGQIPELVDEGCGILGIPGDPTAIADALQRLYDQPALRCRMGIAGREKIVREFNLNSSTAMRADLFFLSADGCRSSQRLADTALTEPALVTQPPLEMNQKVKQCAE